MRILLCNDDGYQAQGICTLAKALEEAGHEIFVVAPSEERSGQSHAMTFFRPVLTRQVSSNVWSVHGTPADCATIGIQNILADKAPDIVVSGINHGLNVGWDVNYSGTVGAATEAALLGYKAIAVSTDIDWAKNPTEVAASFEGAAQMVVQTLKEFSKIEWRSMEVLNINHPGRAPKGLRKAACGGYSMYVPMVAELKPSVASYPNMKVFMLGGSARRNNGDTSQDVTLVQEGYVTFSMLQARQTSLGVSSTLEPLLSAIEHVVPKALG
jgi:5'-nucleotidase